MKSKFALLTALVAALLPVAAIAQATPAAPQPAVPAASTAPAETAAPSPAAPAKPAATAAQAPALVPPSAFPARIALIMFTEAVYNTNEGQRAVADLMKKYQPQKDKLDALATEIDTLRKQLQAAPATMPDEERAAKLKVIDTKDKQYQRDGDDASTAYNADLQEALGKVAQKLDVVMRKYVSDNGYTLLLNAGDQQNTVPVVMWAAAQPNADITAAVIDAYNAASGVAPLPPAAPAAATHPKPASTTTPRTTTTPKPAAAK
jgi:outer membrane protein